MLYWNIVISWVSESIIFIICCIYFDNDIITLKYFNNNCETMCFFCEWSNEILHFKIHVILNYRFNNIYEEFKINLHEYWK